MDLRGQTPPDKPFSWTDFYALSDLLHVQIHPVRIPLVTQMESAFFMVQMEKSESDA